MLTKHYKKVCVILGILVVSCSHKKLELQHLLFFDVVSDTYKLGDTAKANPHFIRSMYFSINQSNLKNINTDELDLKVKTDSAIQNQLKKGYYRVDVICYKGSDNLDAAIKKHSNKLLTLCNDDIVAEYVWEEGQIIMSFYYHNGKIMGSEKIKLENVSKDL